MMRFLATAGLCAVLSLGMGVTPAAADIRAAFGNTIVSRYPDGGTVRHYFDADGSYSARFSDGRSLTGRWAIEGGQVCLNNIRPRIMLISRFCTEMRVAEVGDSWQSRDPLGRRVSNQLVAGR